MQVGPYTVLDEVARGGMGVVYRARGSDGLVVALKLLLPQRAANAKLRQRFQAEVEALARLKHPGVVRVRGHGEHEGAPWLALDFVEGETLQTRLRRGPLTLDQSLDVTRQLGEALDYVHSQGLLHRDLKPDNVLLRGDQALLTDFGLVLDADSDESRITATGTFLGTPGYWPPEQALGAAHLCTRQTDVFGLGALLYACLTGQAPVQANTLQEALDSKCFRAVTSPRRLRPGVPDWLSALCLRCLHFAPTARPRTVGEVVRALQSGDAQPSGARSPALAIGLSAAAGACLLLGGLLWFGGRQTPPTSLQRVAEQEATSVSAEREREDRRQALILQDQVAEAFRRGEALYEAKRYEAALREFTDTIALDPTHALAYAFRARAHGQTGNLDTARADALRALELDPACAPAHIELGRHAFDLAEFERSLEHFSKAIELDPTARAFRYRANLLRRLERYDEALDDLRKAVSRQPGDVALYVIRAHVQGKRQQFDEALADLRRAARVDPFYAPLYSLRAELLFSLQRFPEALQAVNRVLELKPDSVEFLAQRGGLLNLLGKPLPAIKTLTRAIQLDPKNGRAFSERGAAYMSVDRYAEGIADLDKAIELGPAMPVNYYNRGYGKKILERWAEAIEDFDTADQLSSRSVKTALGRAECLVGLERYDEALAACEQASQRATSSFELAHAQVQRGKCRFAQGLYAEAIADYDRAEPSISPDLRPALQKLRDTAEAKLLAKPPE